jgi:Mlc titration factor MtfA (ptsG expression regulator)
MATPDKLQQVFLEQQRLIADATDQAIGQNFEHVTGQLTGLTSAVYTQRMSQIVQNGQSYRTRAAAVNTTLVNSKDLLNSNRHKQQGTVIQSYSYISSSPSLYSSGFNVIICVYFIRFMIK